MPLRKNIAVFQRHCWGAEPRTAPPGASADAETARSAAAGVDYDTGLMLRAQGGDLVAFEELVKRFCRPLLGFLFRIVHDQAIAEELAQEAFLRVYRSRLADAAMAKLSTRLYWIAANLAINHARDKSGRRGSTIAASIDERGEDAGSAVVASPALNTEQAPLKRERVAAIQRHIDALPERQRLAVLMHKYQGLDYREIGEVLALSESETKSLLFVAYETLREKLKEFL